MVLWITANLGKDISQEKRVNEAEDDTHLNYIPPQSCGPSSLKWALRTHEWINPSWKGPEGSQRRPEQIRGLRKVQGQVDGCRVGGELE